MSQQSPGGGPQDLSQAIMQLNLASDDQKKSLEAAQLAKKLDEEAKQLESEGNRRVQRAQEARKKADEAAAKSADNPLYQAQLGGGGGANGRLDKANHILKEFIAEKIGGDPDPTDLEVAKKALERAGIQLNAAKEFMQGPDSSNLNQQTQIESEAIAPQNVLESAPPEAKAEEQKNAALSATKAEELKQEELQKQQLKQEELQRAALQEQRSQAHQLQQESQSMNAPNVGPLMPGIPLLSNDKTLREAVEAAIRRGDEHQTNKNQHASFYVDEVFNKNQNKLQNVYSGYYEDGPIIDNEAKAQKFKIDLFAMREGEVEGTCMFVPRNKPDGTPHLDQNGLPIQDVIFFDGAGKAEACHILHDEPPVTSIHSDTLDQLKELKAPIKRTSLSVPKMDVDMTPDDLDLNKHQSEEVQIDLAKRNNLTQDNLSKINKLQNPQGQQNATKTRSDRDSSYSSVTSRDKNTRVAETSELPIAEISSDALKKAYQKLKTLPSNEAEFKEWQAETEQILNAAKQVCDTLVKESPKVQVNEENTVQGASLTVVANIRQFKETSGELNGSWNDSDNKLKELTTNVQRVLDEFADIINTPDIKEKVDAALKEHGISEELAETLRGKEKISQDLQEQEVSQDRGSSELQKAMQAENQQELDALAEERDEAKGVHGGLTPNGDLQKIEEQMDNLASNQNNVNRSTEAILKEQGVFDNLPENQTGQGPIYDFAAGPKVDPIYDNAVNGGPLDEPGNMEVNELPEYKEPEYDNSYNNALNNIYAEVEEVVEAGNTLNNIEAHNKAVDESKEPHTTPDSTKEEVHNATLGVKPKAETDLQKQGIDTTQTVAKPPAPKPPPERSTAFTPDPDAMCGAFNRPPHTVTKKKRGETVKPDAVGADAKKKRDTKKKFTPN